MYSNFIRGLYRVCQKYLSGSFQRKNVCHHGYVNLLNFFKLFERALFTPLIDILKEYFVGDYYVPKVISFFELVKWKD